MYNKKEKKVKFEKYQKLPGDAEVDFGAIDFKKENNLEYLPKEKVAFRFRIKRFWFGLIKERKRIAWPKAKDLGVGMVTVLAVMILFAAVFYGITKLIILTGIVF